jgi:flagellar biosynthesis/type III secretory pathway M-ring protein FliF/YscJ
MVTELIIVWVLAVVAFFVLWAILAKVVQRISNRKEREGELQHSSDTAPTQVHDNTDKPSM